MKPELLNTLHILIVDGKPGNARLLRGILLGLGITNVSIAEDTHRALDSLGRHRFQAVFCDEAVGPLEAPDFALAVRRKADIRNPKTPIVLVSDGPQRAQVEKARDAGINDLLVRPLSVNSVQRKLATLLASPKLFVATEAFFGPDRRRERVRGGLHRGAPVREQRPSSPRRRRNDRSAPGTD